MVRGHKNYKIGCGGGMSRVYGGLAGWRSLCATLWVVVVGRCIQRNYVPTMRKVEKANLLPKPKTVTISATMYRYFSATVPTIPIPFFLASASPELLSASRVCMYCQLLISRLAGLVPPTLILHCVRRNYRKQTGRALRHCGHQVREYIHGCILFYETWEDCILCIRQFRIIFNKWMKHWSQSEAIIVKLKRLNK